MTSAAGDAPAGLRLEVGAALTADEVNAAYAWAEWPPREAWRLDAISHSCTWLAARDADGALLGVTRLLDDGGLHAALWDVIVRADHRGQGIGRALVEAALARCGDRSLVGIVSTPDAAAFFAHVGFVTESHGHVAMYLRPHRSEAGHGHGTGDA